MQKITVQGIEYDLELTVGAFAEISEACPNGDFSRIDELFQLPPGKAMLAAAKMLAAMSRGAEEKKIRARFCRQRLTAMAVMSTERLGAPRRGL